MIFLLDKENQDVHSFGLKKGNIVRLTFTVGLISVSQPTFWFIFISNKMFCGVIQTLVSFLFPFLLPKARRPNWIPIYCIDTVSQFQSYLVSCSTFLRIFFFFLFVSNEHTMYVDITIHWDQSEKRLLQAKKVWRVFFFLLKKSPANSMDSPVLSFPLRTFFGSNN